MDKKRAFIAFFWAAGMIYTGHNLIENCIRYKQYNSMTINKYDKNGYYNIFIELLLSVLNNFFSATTFPKLRICSHSQHSLAKVQKLYPDLDPEIMQKLYGFASSREEKDLWNKLVITKDHILKKPWDISTLVTDVRDKILA